ncbi:MAG TPA: FlgD immunoglobulin-like domain containing protein, partial [Candidatus Polarisedimenticolia bacterium]|nr:FlgD immunoglobulin-like domain containing protein [Candidatus Polarisedimenticolia bacterium]
VFNAQGRQVRTLETGMLTAGTHVLHWDGRLDGGGSAASGVYWIRVAAGAATKHVKLVVAR